MPESFERGALTEATYLILLALTTPMHGYGVMQTISDMTNARVVLGAGTLYGALNLLLEKQWIAVTPQSAGGRKKEYTLTQSGKAAIYQEMQRLEELTRLGKQYMGGETV
ncbi:PadR family transcriptional regulator [Christensenellaceae bacterium OttesenSCG-928-L17]|nr:PadR family transcriptional regulator [Christensenellaceae bacterium OttesenSCG-928-L17]